MFIDHESIPYHLQRLVKHIDLFHLDPMSALLPTHLPPTLALAHFQHRLFVAPQTHLLTRKAHSVDELVSTTVPTPLNLQPCHETLRHGRHHLHT
jgi:hypothetical protein